MKTTISTDVLSAAVAAVRSQRPLVHNITNYVVMNNSANALLAIGASPVMAHWEDEMAEMTAIAGALVINIGTLDSRWISGMKAAGMAASRRGTPIVLDPVGAGATSQRTAAVVELIELCKPTIIRGNGSEIMTVASLMAACTASSLEALLSTPLLLEDSSASCAELPKCFDQALATVMISLPFPRIMVGLQSSISSTTAAVL